MTFFFLKGERERKKEKRGRVSYLQIKTTFGNLLKEAYLHLYEDWVGMGVGGEIRLLQPLNCQISLEISPSYISRVNLLPSVTRPQPGGWGWGGA